MHEIPADTVLFPRPPDDFLREYEIGRRIGQRTVLTDLEVEVIARRRARQPDRADLLSGLHVVPLGDEPERHVGVQGRKSAAVVDQDVVAVAVMIRALLDLPRRVGVHLGAGRTREVKPAVEVRDTPDAPPAELGRGPDRDARLERPARRRERRFLLLGRRLLRREESRLPGRFVRRRFLFGEDALLLLTDLFRFELFQVGLELVAELLFLLRRVGVFLRPPDLVLLQILDVGELLVAEGLVVFDDEVFLK